MSESQPTTVPQPNPPTATSEKSNHPVDRLPRLFLVALGIILVLTVAIMFGFFL